VDILVGTQMIAKGLDFPNVTLVGILNADATLNVPDFRAAERTFQLLTQMSGRAGRGEIAGEVIVQTRSPEHPAIQCALRTDYEGFFRHEMEMRRAGFYPPCSHLVVITVRGFSAERTLFSADHLATRIRAALPDHVLMAGPQESPMAKLRNQHRVQLVLRARTALLITRVLRPLLLETKLPEDVHVQVDVDALSML
jgi:primosomal protein N' (replication factor Y) (superfamily II helicase)